MDTSCLDNYQDCFFMLQHSFEGDERFLKMNTQRCILLFAVFLNKCDFKHWVIIKHSQHNKILFWNVKFLFSHWPCTDSAIIIILQMLNQGPVHIVLVCSKMCTFLCVLLLCPHFNCLGIWDYMNRGSATMVLLLNLLIAYPLLLVLVENWQNHSLRVCPNQKG